MILIAHILIALGSLIAATAALLAPSQTKLVATYGLTGLTLVTGTYLVATTGVNLLHACVTGLVYSLAVTMLAVAAHRRLVTV